MSTSDNFEKSADARTNDVKESTREFRQLFFGSVFLVLMTAVTIFATTYCYTEIDKIPFNIAKAWLFHFGVTFTLWIATAFCFWGLRKFVVTNIKFKLSKTIECLVNKLTGTDIQQGLVPRIESGVENLEKKIEQIGGILKTTDLLNRGVILYSNNSENVLAEFLREDIASDATAISTVRIVATAKGLVGKHSFSLGRHIADFMKKRREADGNEDIPFNEFRLVIPDNRNAQEVVQRGYHFCARYFILDVIKSILDIYSSNNASTLNKCVTFKIRFNGTDIFPAWHIWGNKRVVVVPSVGFKEKYTLAELLPVGIVLKDSFHKDMQHTIARLIGYYDADLFQVNNNNPTEEWILQPNGTVEVNNFNKEVAGNMTKLKEHFHGTKFNDAYDVFYKLQNSKESIIVIKNNLSQYMDAFGILGLIEL